MAANWSTFTTNLKEVFGTPNQKTISDIADLHATEYISAVLESSIVLTGSKVTSITKPLIKSAYEQAFTSLSVLKIELKPNYLQGEAKTDKERLERAFLESIFKPVALAICAEWQKEIFTAATIPPGYVSPSPGYNVLTPGDPISLSRDLAKAFSISQTILNPEESVNTFIKTLVEAYTKHMLLISGTFIGLVPGTPAVLGPPFPYVGVA